MSLGSQRTSGLFHKQVTVARQASLPGSPQVLRNPLLRQRRVGCYDANDGSDEEEFGGEGDCISLPGSLPGPSRPLTEDDSRHALVTSPKIRDVNKQEEPQKTQVSKASSVPLLGSSLYLEESVPEGMVDASSQAASLLGSAEAPRNCPGGSGRKELSGSRSSPKLEYKVHIDTQNVKNTENPVPPEKSENLTSRHKPVARVSPHCKRPEAESSCSETVSLTGKADGLCGQDLKIQATAFNKIVTGLPPDGTVEEVTDFLLLL